MYKILGNILYYIEKYCVDYIDVDYSLWVTWLLLPLIISFLLPLVIGLLLYSNAVILYIYKLHRYRLRDAFETDIYDGARKLIAAIWDAHGYIWHGYEVKGLENIPESTPALFIYYHGAIPIDLYYFLSRVFLLKNRLIHTVADRFLFKIPGWAIIAEALKVIPGTIQSCSAILKENNLLAISPGGVYEAQFSDSYYRLMWKKRLGFARVALDAKVPIIPIFTQNVRESFRAVGFFRRIWLKLYTWTKFPLVPIYGGFPVKLRTHVGAPILYDSSLSPEDLGAMVASALEELIANNQRVPGSIMRALLERIYEPTSSVKNQ
uniref:Phospholipid/glycerol acyltransferase domain-containing protein n=1 Tax=Homalodisca liturata TaxID=320908 RepID=A0A1B6J306_9HEMI